MQGRLSPPIDGKIQAFPSEKWREEFPLGESCGFQLMEWTLDHQNLWENPLMTPEGRQEIRVLSARYGIRIESATADNFMQAPFFKRKGPECEERLSDLKELIEAAGHLGLKYIVIPVLDEGRMESPREREKLREGLNRLRPDLLSAQVKFVFESDLPPQELAEWIATYEADAFGVNYDIGNSAGSGFDSSKEFEAFGHRILNVHIKDRELHGTTVPLGEGNANFDKVFQGLKKIGYQGNFILQTARAIDGDHLSALRRYRDFATSYIEG